MKKIVSICLALSMILSLSLCAFADYEPGVEPAEIEEVAIDVSLEDAISGVSRSLSKPTEFWDLSRRNYSGRLDVVGIDRLYSNYYFSPNANNKINVTYTIYSDTGRATKMVVGLYDITDNRQTSAKWTSNGATREGITESFNFINLNPEHHYAITFQAVFDGISRDTVHGTATIRH